MLQEYRQKDTAREPEEGLEEKNKTRAATLPGQRTSLEMLTTTQTLLELKFP